MLKVPTFQEIVDQQFGPRITKPSLPLIDTGSSKKTYKNTSGRKTSAAVAQPAIDYEKEYKRNLIEGQKLAQKRLLNANLDMQKQEAKKQSDDNMKQLYISYMNGIKNMPQQQALWVAGGEIESLKNKSRLNYENNRAGETKSYSSNLAKIQQKYNEDLQALEQRYLSLLMGV